MLTQLARAKLNLSLHVLRQRADGYHEIDSLVAFTSLADTLRVEPASGLSLQVDGPFAPLAGEGEGNLVLKAARALQGHASITLGAAFTLTKSIPVGAGLGGGSADAAAALRLLNGLWELQLPPKILKQLALPLGADVPMCIDSTPAIARGIGEVLAPMALPTLHAVLVYPRVKLLTADVYRAFTLHEESPPIAWPVMTDAQRLLALLRTTRNDLQRPAIAVCPVVAEVLLALETTQPQPDFVRMSGSGACCFALYEHAADAGAAAQNLRATYPDWWVENVEVSGQ